jgi:hypothetical protein
LGAGFGAGLGAGFGAGGFGATVLTGGGATGGAGGAGGGTTTELVTGVVEVVVVVVVEDLVVLGATGSAGDGGGAQEMRTGKTTAALMARTILFTATPQFPQWNTVCDRQLYRWPRSTVTDFRAVIIPWRKREKR